MTDSFPDADASQKFIAKVFAVITRSLTSDESMEERKRERKKEKESELQRYGASKVRSHVTARRYGKERVLHRIGAGRLVAGCIQKKGPQENAARSNKSPGRF